MQRMLNRDLPVDDPERMLLWYASLSSGQQNKLSSGLRMRLTKLRIDREQQSATTQPGVDRDLEDFRKTYKPGGQADNSTLAALREKRDYYLFKIERAEARGDQAAVGDATRQLAQFANIIHDAELRALKAGRDLDDLIPRKNVEQIMRFIGYHLLRVADHVLGQLTSALTAGDATGARLTAEEIRAIAEPILLSSHVFQPIARAAAGDNIAAPPDWLVAALKAGGAEVIEESPARPAAPASPPSAAAAA